mgnify:CR=1 FL=1
MIKKDTKSQVGNSKMKNKIKMEKIYYEPKSFQEVWNAVMEYLKTGKITIYFEEETLELRKCLRCGKTKRARMCNSPDHVHKLKHHKWTQRKLSV